MANDLCRRLFVLLPLLLVMCAPALLSANDSDRATPNTALSGPEILNATGRPLPPDLTPEAVRDLLRTHETVPSSTPVPEARSAGPAPASAPSARHAPDTSTSDDPVPHEPPSPLERLYRERYGSPAAAGLNQFGYDIFSGTPVNTDAPAPGPGYRLAAGDSLLVRITAPSLNRDFSAPVGSDGAISLPGMGSSPVAGRTLAQAETAVAEQVRLHHPGARVLMALDRGRDLEIYVVGEVHNPGLVSLPAGSTMLNALLAAGGARKTGSLRDIRLLRDQKIVGGLDLYELLLSGRSEDDRRLAARDTVLVPRIGSTAAVAGAVAHPGIYELEDGARADDLLRLAGGNLPAGALKLHLRRFAPERGSFEIEDVDLAGQGRETRLRNGDLLEVRYLPSDWPEAVTLKGHVRRPDTVSFRPELKLSDLISSPEQLLPGAITDFALLVRYNVESTRHLARAFPLEALLAGGYDEPLQPHDTVIVLSRNAFGVSEPLTLTGAVWREGRFEHAPGMTLVDLLGLGGGLRFGADSSRIELTRRIVENGRSDTRLFVLDLESSRAFPLAPYDSVRIPAIKDATAFRHAEIRGEVRYPGLYRIQSGETLSDLVRRAGGFTPEAYFFGAKFTSPRAREIQQRSIDRLIAELEILADKSLAVSTQTALSPEDSADAAAHRMGIARMLAHLREVKAEGRVAIVLADLPEFAGSSHDFALEDGDRLEIPARPSFVSVVGSVFTPGSFLYRPRSEVEDYLDKSGGPTPDADEDHIYVLRANGEVVSRAQTGLARNFDSLALMPGDTVVVPQDLERIPYFRLAQGMADILFKIATTAGVALAVL